MLSLKASRADNFYYGSIEDEKSKKKKEKEIKKKNNKDYCEIKFEIPYTIICKKCDIYIYKGERFNSERKKAGYYLSTCFYSFSIYCKNCLNKIIIETNPKNCSYDIIDGARKKNENYKNILTQKGKNNINTIDLEEIKKKKVNPFLLLEKKLLHNKNSILHDKKDENNVINEIEEYKIKKEEKHEIVGKNEEKENIEEYFDITSTDEDINDIIKENYKRNYMLKKDYVCNSNLRKQLREIKKDKIKIKEEYKKKNIFIDILNDPFEDLKLKKYISLNEKYKKNIKEKKKFLKSHLITKRSSIFDKKYLKGK